MYYNLYFEPEKLGLEILIFDEPKSYAYNMLLFAREKQGKAIYVLEDSGCSCPSPFENYNGETAKDLFKGMERVKTFKHAREIFDGWNENCYDGKTPTIDFETSALRSWFGLKVKS